MNFPNLLLPTKSKSWRSEDSKRGQWAKTTRNSPAASPGPDCATVSSTKHLTSNSNPPQTPPMTDCHTKLLNTWEAGATHTKARPGTRREETISRKSSNALDKVPVSAESQYGGGWQVTTQWRWLWTARMVQPPQRYKRNRIKDENNSILSMGAGKDI